VRTGLIVFLFTALPLLTFLSLEVHARTGLLFSFHYSFIVLVSGRYFCLRGGRVGIYIIFHVFHVFMFFTFYCCHVSNTICYVYVYVYDCNIYIILLYYIMILYYIILYQLYHLCLGFCFIHNTKYIINTLCVY
jgi:hypothetical protein